MCGALISCSTVGRSSTFDIPLRKRSAGRTVVGEGFPPKSFVKMRRSRFYFSVRTLRRFSFANSGDQSMRLRDLRTRLPKTVDATIRQKTQSPRPWMQALLSFDLGAATSSTGQFSQQSYYRTVWEPTPANVPAPPKGHLASRGHAVTNAECGHVVELSLIATRYRSDHSSLRVSTSHFMLHPDVRALLYHLVRARTSLLELGRTWRSHINGARVCDSGDRTAYIVKWAAIRHPTYATSDIVRVARQLEEYG